MTVAVVRHVLPAIVCLLLTGAVLSDNVCQTEDCWRMSASLHAGLNTSADPCADFDAFLCDGFRSSHQFTGESLLSDKAYMEYLPQIGNAYSERVTEQLATGCRDQTCSDPWQPVSPKLRAYERVASQALRDCAYMEAIANQSLSDLVKINIHNVLDEAIDLGLAGIAMSPRRSLRFESLLPAQSAKSLLSPLLAVANVARRNGRPAVLLVATEPLLGLRFVSRLFSLFPIQATRMLRRLQMAQPRGLEGLIRNAQFSLILWDFSCNRTATDVANASSHRPMRTVADAKRLLRAANLTFDLDEFLQLSMVPWGLAVNDSTDLLLPDPATFLNTVCLLDMWARRRPDLVKVLIMHQITLLAAQVLGTPDDARCIEEFFGLGDGSRSSAPGLEGTLVGAFRPLLHGRYARAHAQPAIEVEARDLFARLKATYVTAMVAKEWISPGMVRLLAQRLQTMEFAFQRELVTEATLLHHYSNVMDSMPAGGCTLATNPACLLVRTRALQMSLAIRTSHMGLDSDSPHYAQLRHTVYLTPAFAEPPHYRPGQPLALRIGQLGFVLAHELTHGLLAEADPTEVMKQKLEDVEKLPASWTEEFAGRFRAREACLRDRLITRQGLNKTSVVEDVADLVGLSVGYRMLQESGDTQRLPGYMARYSPAQLFYIASMRLFCSKAVPNFWRRFLSVSASVSHTPGAMRIQSMMAGDANFSRAFECPANARPGTAPNGTPDLAAEERKACDFW